MGGPGRGSVVSAWDKSPDPAPTQPIQKHRTRQLHQIRAASLRLGSIGEVKDAIRVGGYKAPRPLQTIIERKVVQI